MITRDSVETAYSFLHQKRNVYVHSSIGWQRDEIEYAIASYVDDMSRELYDEISMGEGRFPEGPREISGGYTSAVERLEEML